MGILSYPRRDPPHMLSAEAPTRLRKRTLPLRCLAGIGARRGGPLDLRRRLALARGEAQGLGQPAPRGQIGPLWVELRDS